MIDSLSAKAVGRLRDGFANIVSALGANNAKVSANQYIVDFAGQSNVELAYRTSTWFGKIVDIPADDATREWRSWKAGTKIIEDVEREERRLGIRAAVRQALIWARLYGGSVIVMGGLRGSSASELDLDTVRRGDLKYVHVLSRYQIQADGELRTDPTDPYCGHPEFYTVRRRDGRDHRIHPSRVVRLRGRIVTSESAGTDGVWGDSVWMSLMDAVQSSDSTSAVMASLMHEAKIDVIKINGLMDSVGTADYEALLIERFRLANQMKSVGNALIIDAADDWQQKQVQWNGIPQVMESFLITMAGAADIPVTRLLGTSAKGLNSTGEGDLKNYYDMVRARQQIDLDPALAILDEVLVRSTLGRRPADVWHEWIPLYQMTDMERAETDKTEAETLKIYKESGLLPERALAKSAATRMIESGRWPGLEAALEEIPEDARWPDAERPDPVLPAAPKPPQATPAGSAAEVQQAADALRFTDATPRTLYVSRRVENAEEILAWAHSQGFRETVPAEELHVTVIYSRRPVDWMKVGNEYADWSEESMVVPSGGPRFLEQFGEARVLCFYSTRLIWRNEHAQQVAGTTHDFPEYQPHITLSYSAESPDLSTVQPYTGRIVLGPEIFEEVAE